MKVNAISAAEREKMRQATRPAVQAKIQEALGDEGVQLMNQFLDAVDEANSNVYLQ